MTTTTVRIGTAVSIPLSRRALGVGAVLAVLLLVAGLLTLTLGSLGIPILSLPAQVIAPTGSEGFVLTRLRGPRLVTAIGTGAALGIAGALFQTVTRNPLGSPDVIGLGVGASAGAAASALVWPGVVPVPVGALVGATVAMLVVWAGTGRGFSSPSRVIIVGIGVSAMGVAVTNLLIARAGREEATVLAAYINGTLASRSWDDAAIIWASLLVIVPSAMLLGRRLSLIEMGDEIADSLGANASTTRAVSIVVAVAAAAAAVSVAGPVAFIALIAPQVAKRLTRVGGANVAISAITGALLIVAADLAVQNSPFEVQLPVGVLTGAIGGLYLGFLLVREFKKGTI
ncbi:FecCD family ABC transporter permease [Marisediminicola sp. LYQ134]|uniref:FecCD family ABC transporter permease n=1 Tax=Marisediminicola sp. LYQ134 TaxID=3391061 RepID=UPI00398384C1